MNEKQLERKCCREAERRGWIAWKLVCPNRIGVPDRMFVGPEGQTAFVEFKQPGGHIRPTQMRTLEVLTRMGHAVKVVDNYNIFIQYMGWEE